MSSNHLQEYQVLMLDAVPLYESLVFLAELAADQEIQRSLENDLTVVHPALKSFLTRIRRCIYAIACGLMMTKLRLRSWSL